MSLDVKDASGLTKVLKTSLDEGEHLPHHIVEGTVTVSGTVTVGNSVTIDSLPAISGTVTADSNRGNVSEASIKTITTGGTHQQVFASNANRNFLLVQNVSDTDMNLGIGYNPTASTGIFLAKNGSGVVFESNFIPTQEIRILCATTGKAFVALEG